MPFPSPGDLPDPGIERRSLVLQADSLPTVPPGYGTSKVIHQSFRKKWDFQKPFKSKRLGWAGETQGKVKKKRKPPINTINVILFT